jgi:hypothetical protein
MTWAWKLTTSGAALYFAGSKVHPNVSGALLDEFGRNAEGFIEIETRRKWVENYDSLSSGAKYILATVANRIIANDAINYDSSRYAVGEAEFLANVNDDIASRALRQLKDFKSIQLRDP